MSAAHDEAARLSALGEYAILDTVVEPVFDALVQLAAYACIPPLVHIAFIDERRSWIKSSFGWRIAELRDPQKDVRFAGNPLVTNDPNLRYYEGLPLVTREGHAVGVFSVMDRHAGHARDTLDWLRPTDQRRRGISCSCGLCGCQARLAERPARGAGGSHQ